MFASPQGVVAPLVEERGHRDRPRIDELRKGGNGVVPRLWIPRALILIFALAALVVAAAVMAQRPPVLAHAAIAGEVVSLHLVEAGQMVTQGDPLVYVQSPTRSAPALAAVAPVDGRVTRVPVHPGSHVDIGDIVAVIQPL
jgi:hypothetical protein